MTRRQFRLTKPEKGLLQRLLDEHGDSASNNAAKRVKARRFHDHRGAYEVRNRGQRFATECMIFGNDGFNDLRVQKEVAQLAVRLEELEIPIRGFGVEPEGYSWATRVECDDEDLLDLLVWDVWFSITCPKANPVRREFNDYLDDMGYDLAA